MSYCRIYWEDLCGKAYPNSTSYSGVFWDYDLSINTSAPHLTECFQQTGLLWIPCGIFWICALVYIPVICSYPFNRKSANIERSLLYYLKLIIYLALLATLLLDLFSVIILGGQPLYKYLGPAVTIITVILAIIITEIDHRKDVHSSGILQIFWFLTVLAGVIPALSIAERANTEERSLAFSEVLFCLEYALICLHFLLSLWRDFGSKTESEIPEEKQPLLSHSKLKNGTGKLPETHEPCPEDSCTFLSFISNWWITPLLIKGYKKPVTFEDVYELSDRNKCESLLPSFYQKWKPSHENRSLWTLVLAMVKPSTGPFFISGFFRLTHIVFSFISPQLLNLLIAWITERDSPLWWGIMLGVALFVNKILQSLATHLYFKYAYIMAQRIRSVTIASVYKKALNLTHKARKDTTVGEIVNLMAVDAQKLHDSSINIHEIWACPLMVALSMYFLWQFVGPSSMAGLAILCIISPINGAYLARRLAAIQVQQMKFKDGRIKLLNEILSGIKVLKFYAWELSFIQQVARIREKELKCIRTTAILLAVIGVTWYCAPYVVMLAVFTTYVLTTPDHFLSPEKAFVSLNIINILNFSMSFLPVFIGFGSQSYISLKRIRRMLSEEEIDQNAISREYNPGESISIENGEFTWGDDEEDFMLSDINMKVKPGELVAIVGQVGYGKSSMLNAMLGEMRKVKGTVNIQGSTAYVAQQAWMQNMTLRDNILFGKTYNPSKYNKILNSCALRPDLQILAGGDMTEIGEKGINLSGGQKQRVSLARAVYNDCDIYLLDDVLSAVDAHVGKHIFNQVIGPNGMLKHKTRILVTHGVTYLPQVDKVIVLKDGKIEEQGTYEELVERDGGFAEFIRNYLQESNEESDPEVIEMRETLKRQISRPSDISESEELERARLRRRSSRIRTSESRSEIISQSFTMSGDIKDMTAQPADGKLIEAEEEAIGAITKETLLSYIRGGGIFMFVFLIICQLMYTVSVVLTNMWLSAWSDDSTKQTNTTDLTALTNLRLGVYGGLGAFQVLGMLFLSLAVFLGGIRASRLLHTNLTSRILHAPMSFFDTTPIGRIVNRFSTDIDRVDNAIPVFVRSWCFSLAVCLSTVIVITYSTPWFLIPLIPICILYVIIQVQAIGPKSLIIIMFLKRLYIATVRQLKRIDSVRKSPIYTHFDETLVGVSTVRAYKQQENFSLRNELLVDQSQMAWYPILIGQRWLGLTLELLGALIVLSASLLAVAQKDTISGGLAGLSVSFAIDATWNIYVLVRNATDLETFIVSVERIEEYSNVENEAPWNIENTKQSPEWPSEGQVQFQDYGVRYRPGLELVLKDISAKFEPGERVGIVGRTGAGKSSLTLSLFRIIEAAEGQILIDGINIADLGLHDLRKKLTIIPQDPVIFSGTLRMNLDPFNAHTDEEIMKALEHAHLKSFITSVSEGLQYECGEGGSALSVGQRQLVCLGRALLRKTKILILDEATAAVDMETDDIIQQTIRQEFQACTVLTIAHRINTIVDYDRVLVLDDGRIAELDSPHNLLNNTNSIFHSMSKSAGLT